MKRNADIGFFTKPSSIDGVVNDPSMVLSGFAGLSAYLKCMVATLKNRLAPGPFFLAIMVISTLHQDNGSSKRRNGVTAVRKMTKNAPAPFDNFGHFFY